MLRFLTGVSLRATVLAGLIGVALLAVAGPVAERMIWWIVPEGSTLYLSSETAPGVHRAIATFAFVLPSALGWIVAAARGFRRGTPSGYGVIAVCIGAITAVGAARALLQVSTLRALWRDASATIPAVDLGSLDHWESAMIAMVVTTAVMLFVVLRRASGRPR